MTTMFNYWFDANVNEHFQAESDEEAIRIMKTKPWRGALYVRNVRGQPRQIWPARDADR